MFDKLIQEYPVTAISWYDRGSPPSLKKALHKFRGILVGGLDEKVTLTTGTPESVRKEVLDAISQTGRRRLILGPCCILLMNYVDGNLDQVVRTAREHLACEDFQK